MDHTFIDNQIFGNRDRSRSAFMRWSIPKWNGYIIAITSETAVTAILYLVQIYLVDVNFRIPFVVITSAIAYRLGAGPALLAFLVGLFGYMIFLLEPRYTIAPAEITVENWVRLLTLTFWMLVSGVSMLSIRQSQIEARQRAEELRQSVEQISSMIESVTEAFFALDSNWQFTYVNPKAEELLHRSRGELLGTCVRSVFPGTIGPELFKEIERAESEQTPVTVDVCDSTYEKWFEARIYPFATGLSVYLEDITDRIQIEQQKLDFYRRTIKAATGGKLEIIEQEDTTKIIGPSLAEWSFSEAHELKTVRGNIANIMKSDGISEDDISLLIEGVGEALNNALKHAGGGTVSIHKSDGSVLVAVTDQGPGIEALEIPEVALTSGYSTVGTLGMGFTLMIGATDKIHLATGPEGTTVVLEKIMMS